MNFRQEKDTMGVVNVPADVFWGAQTQRSIENFKIALPNTRIELDTIKMKYNGFRAYQNFADIYR